MLTARYRVLGLTRGEWVLDLGCGFGRHAFEAARRGAHVVALDAGAEEVRSVATMFAAMRLENEIDETVMVDVVQGDALHLPFADATFDRVICSEVLEHIDDDEAVLRELARVTRPGGRLALTVPRYVPELVNWTLSDAYHQVEGGHIRIYRRRVLESRIRRAGLEVSSHHFAHGLHTPYWWLKCLVGTTNDEHWLVRHYHRFLVWDIVKAPRTSRLLDAILTPVIGKSLVIYVDRPS